MQENLRLTDSLTVLLLTVSHNLTMDISEPSVAMRIDAEVRERERHKETHTLTLYISS